MSATGSADVRMTPRKHRLNKKVNDQSDRSAYQLRGKGVMTMPLTAAGGKNSGAVSSTPVQHAHAPPNIDYKNEERSSVPLKQVKLMLDEFEKTFLKTFEEKLDTLISLRLKKLTDDVDKLQKSNKKLNAKVNELQLKLDDCRKCVSDCADFGESEEERNRRYHRSADVVIRGIPSENLKAEEITKKIFRLVGHTPSPHVRSYFTKGRKVGAVGRNKAFSPPLVIKFSGCGEAGVFRSLAWKKRKEGVFNIRMLDGGFSSDPPIFVGDNLTPQAAKLFATARNLKKKNIIHSAFTLDGMVYVRSREGERSTRIACQENFHTFLSTSIVGNEDFTSAASDDDDC